MLTAFLPFLMIGLASSLHCIGMCGPILATFSQVIRSHEVRLLTDQKKQSVVWEFAFYHLGRIWTYALLGALAGGVGQIVGMGGLALGIRQGVGIAVGLMTVLGGCFLLGLLPSPKSLETSFLNHPLLKQATGFLFSRGGAFPRLLLGILMGFLPCGLVYAMLVAAAAFQNPLWGAAAMVVFGIGTLPSLTAVLWASHIIPLAWRQRGTQIAGAVILLTGLWIAGRSATSPETCPYCRLGMTRYEAPVESAEGVDGSGQSNQIPSDTP